MWHPAITPASTTNKLTFTDKSAKQKALTLTDNTDNDFILLPPQTTSQIYIFASQ